MATQELTISEGQDGFNDRQKAALVQLGVDGASDADLDIFFHQAVRTGLDPFARQIYMIGRRSKDYRTGESVTKQTVQTGIDGFRLIARRAADKRQETLSMDDTLWADPNGHWHDLWIWDTPPTAAKVTVQVGEAHFSAVAATREYMPTDKNGNPKGQWRNMPAVMIAKCAEALALRKAFPMDLSGVYAGEEMQQADAPVEAAEVPHVRPQEVAAPDPAPQQAPGITGELEASIQEYADALGLDDQTVMRTAVWVTRREVRHVLDLTEAEARKVLDYLRGRYQEQQASQPAQQMEVIQGELVDDAPDGGDVA